MEYLPTKNLETFMKSRQDFTLEKDYKEYLRTYFAATALQGAISAQAGTREMVEMQLEYYLKEYPDLTVRESLARESVKMADELIKALNEKSCNE